MQPGRVCNSIDCQTQHALAEIERRKAAQSRQKAKTERQDTQRRKEAAKTRSELMREAQMAFNAFIRLRDQLADYPCISSGRPLDWSGNNVDSGHWRSVGSAPHLRFDERNCHAQSKHDNRYLAGNAVDYRIGLIARIGLEAVEALESDNTPRKWSADDLRRIRDEYRAKLRTLRNQK